jgi:hypothetical protein
LLLSMSAPAAPPGAERLVGAWRLVRIEAKGEAGKSPDPFYGEGSEGLLIYDPSGWFSVQIMGAARPHVDAPASRPLPATGTAATARAAALDSYYAYYGTWTFDPATSTVTHHALGTMYPGEQGATYAQHVEFDGTRMSFIRRQGHAPHETVQTKVWERVTPP